MNSSFCFKTNHALNMPSGSEGRGETNEEESWIEEDPEHRLHRNDLATREQTNNKTSRTRWGKRRKQQGEEPTVTPSCQAELSSHILVQPESPESPGCPLQQLVQTEEGLSSNGS